jgi:hypothetical protein
MLQNFLSEHTWIRRISENSHRRDLSDKRWPALELAFLRKIIERAQELCRSKATKANQIDDLQKIGSHRAGRHFYRNMTRHFNDSKIV